MNMYKYHIVCIAILSLSCEGPVFDVPANQDSIPPTLTITFPADQSVLSDTVIISAYAFDNVELDTVTIYLNDSVIHQSKDGPYEHSWITQNYAEDEFHTIRAKAQDLSGNVNYTNTIQVMIDNQDNVDPTGTLIFPFTGQTLTGEVTIIVEASDNDSVSSVTIYIDGDTVSTLSAPPYTYTWNTINEVDDIIYTIHSHVQDNSGNQITLGPINVLIDNYEADDNIAPTGTITHPASGSTVSGTIDIQVNAYDNVQMGFVDFIIDGSAVAQDSIPPYIYTWNTLEEMEDTDHIINVNLSDSAGNETSLYPVTVYVNNIDEPDETPPTIVIYDPAANQTVSGTVSFLTIATDNVGINRVEFYHNYTLEHTATSYPYTYEWNSTAMEDDSEHIWYAKAFDTSGNEAQTQPIAIYVDNEDNIHPTGFILYPYAGQTVSGVVQIQVSASDNTGIAQVEFFIDTILAVTDSQEPFNYDWDTAFSSEDEDHVISVTITDLGGNSINLSPIVVTVNNDDTPENDITPPVIAILTPLSSQTVSDSVLISGVAADNIGVSQVQFFVDYELIATVNDSPYSTLWNTYDLPNDSSYVIQMTAQDIAGNVSTALPVYVIVENNYFGLINNLTIFPNEESITLTWDAPYDASSFKIYRDGEFLAETSDQTYDDIIGGGIQYCYTISVVNNVAIEGPQSGEQCGVPLLPAPGSFSVTVDYDYVVLNWSAVEQASGYIISRNDSEIWSGNAVTYTDEDLEYNSNYIYTVNAFDFQNTNGTTSAPLTVTTPEELTAPVLSLTVIGSEAILNWGSVSTADAYRIYRDDEFYAQITELTDTIYIGIVDYTCFTVSAVNSYEAEAISNEECGTGELNSPSLSMTISGTEATLSWGSVPLAESYRIYQDNEFLVEITELTYTIDIGNEVYTCFTVSALNEYDDESSPSNEECGSGELTAPILSLTLAGTEATLSWGSVPSAESYRIYQDNEFLVEITELTYTIDIGTGTNICFTVTAINSYGVESSISNEECGTGS